MNTFKYTTKVERIRPIGQEKMIATFLVGELDSERFGDRLRKILKRKAAPLKLLRHPRLNDPRENALRAEIMADFRGMGANRDIFEGFPASLRWEIVRLTKQELARVKYIAYDYWQELSGGSRMPADAARNIRNGKEAFGVPNDRFSRAADALRQGKVFPTLICVAEDERSDIVVLEGHLRLTAYFLAPETIPKTLDIILGCSPEIRKWDLYGSGPDLTT